MMQVSSITPPWPLSAHVDAIWYFIGDDLGHPMERVVPDGSMQLLVNLDENELRWQIPSDCEQQRVNGAAIAGAWSSSFLIDTRQQRHITGVSFRPGGAAAFLAMSCAELRESHVALDDIFPGSTIREQLLSSQPAQKGPSDLFQVWITFLLNRLGAHQSPDWLNQACELLGTHQSVAAVSAVCSLGSRRFRAEFSRAVGISPKAFARVRRLQRVMEQLARMNPSCKPVWAEIALSNGYFDQAHLHRDFRLLAGTTPMAYRPRDLQDWNHCIV